MWQAIKVWVLRKYYRFISARGWKGHADTPNWGAVEIPGTAGPIKGRLYAGNSRQDKPLIIYFHGGGWVIGDLQTHTAFCQYLNKKSGCSVVSVDYRLAPRHPFPAAPDDCMAATRWIAAHIGDFGPSNHRIVLAGDSAGANLATATCLETGPELRHQIAAEILLYPATDHYSAEYPSYVEKATGQTLTTKLMIFFWDTYLGEYAESNPQAARAFPMRSAELGGLPPTFLVTAENDPLRDEGRAYGNKLQQAGVALQCHHFDTAAHGFACSEGPNENFVAMMDELLAWLDQLD